MERTAFELLHSMEHSWWYRARSRAVEVALARVSARPHRVLDFGCGWGGMQQALARNGAVVSGYEPDETARAVAASRGYDKIHTTEVAALDHSYDCIALLDVLEHIGNDRAFLAHARSALTPGGILLISVPAFQFLWSEHDVQHQHFRRYTISRLSDALRAEGYTVRYASYWNFTLFLPAALMRLMGRTGESSLSMPRWLDQLFYTILGIEAFFMRIVPLPVGTGIIAIAERTP